MTEERKDPNVPEEILEDSGTEVPELELEDVSWEIEESPGGEEVPPEMAPEMAPEPPGMELELEEVPGETPEPFEEPVAAEAAPEFEPELPEVEPQQEVVQEVAPPAPEPEPEPVPEPEPEPVAAPPAPEQPVYEEADIDFTAEWGWKVVRSGFNPFIFEFNTQRHMFHGNSVDWVEDVEGLNSFFTYLVDYPESPGMGLLTLSTDPKYADVLARKNLEEQGELSTDGMLQIYSKRKMEGGQISVFYEILPRDRQVALSGLYRNYSKGFVIADSVSLLYGLLKKEGKGAHAFAMHLPGSIVLVAGKAGEVHLARRYTLIGDDAQALNEGIFALEQDLVSLEKNLAQKIHQVNWIEGVTWTLNLSKPDVDIPLVPYPVHELNLNGEQVWSALPSALERMPMSGIIGPKEERWLRPLEKAEKWLWLVMMAVAIVGGAGYWSMKGVHDAVKAQTASLQNKINMVESDIRGRAVNMSVEDVGPAVDLAVSYRQATKYPPFGEMWNYISSLRPQFIRVDGLEMNYVTEGVNLRLEGQVEMDISAAQQGFTEFLKLLEKEGFNIVSQQVTLDLDGNFYSLNILYPVNRGD